MPVAPSISRKQFIDGVSQVLDWELEESLVYGRSQVLDSLHRSLVTREDWKREWARWRGVILPKVIEHRPGTRPFAMYAVGEIPPRRLRLPVAGLHGCRTITIADRSGRSVTHWLHAPRPHLEAEVWHLHRLGIVDAVELRRHREWRRAGGDPYRLEMSLYQ